MTSDVFGDLEAHYADIVAAMPSPEFNSHLFIRELAHRYQRLYVKALTAYQEHEFPFQIVHGEIARRLENHPSLVTKLESVPSVDMFGQQNSAVKWRKVT